MDKFILSYVNFANGTINLDKEFETMIRLMRFVNTNHSAYTSYQVIVLRAKAKAA